MGHSRYFVDVNGVIYTIFPSGESNFPGDFQIEGPDGLQEFSQVQVLGAYEGDESGARLIEDEYVLWDSLTELAHAICGDSVTS